MFSINFDASILTSLLGLGDAIKKEAQQASRDLTYMGHAHAVELAGQRLHSRREMFVKGLSVQQVDANTYFIQLDAGVRWIDEGVKKHSMVDDLLRKGAKTARDGSKYKVIPFQHNKGPARSTPAQMDLTNTIRAEMKTRGIPWGKIERDSGGAPKIGRLHSFSINDRPIRNDMGRGQGAGPVGAVKQGPTGIPLLRGVAVYQKKNDKGQVKRGVMTFRIVSSKHKAQGRWIYPEKPGVNILSSTMDWMENEWEKSVAPALFDRILSAV